MRNTYSYEGILRAVGRVLDNAGVKRIAIDDTGDGLLVEGFDDAGQPRVSLRYDVSALFDLLQDSSERAASSPAMTGDDGTLRHFLERHELVGAR
ncbi:MAG TPA: hypothetical protein VF818_07280 [Ktedonobacterales bacterium]